MMKNRLHFCKEVDDELSRRKSRMLRAQRSNELRLSAEQPELSRLADRIRQTAFEYGEKIMASPKDAEALKSLAKTEISAMESELKRGLEECGLGADFLGPHYTCPVCRDTGVYEGRMCSCVGQLLIDKSFSGSGLNAGESFEAFRHDLIADPKEHRASERIFAFCREYAGSFPENDQPDMLLIGAPGVGKTYLLNCIGGEVLKNGHSVLKLTANRLVNRVMESIRDYSAERPDFTIPELLLIDDLGTEPLIPNVTIETLLSLICERQDLGRATIIASNKDTATLASEYGDRIMSRLVAPNRVRVIKITTPSVRVMKF